VKEKRDLSAGNSQEKNETGEMKNNSEIRTFCVTVAAAACAGLAA